MRDSAGASFIASLGKISISCLLSVLKSVSVWWKHFTIISVHPQTFSETIRKRSCGPRTLLGVLLKISESGPKLSEGQQECRSLEMNIMTVRCFRSWHIDLYNRSNALKPRARMCHILHTCYENVFRPHWSRLNHQPLFGKGARAPPPKARDQPRENGGNRAYIGTQSRRFINLVWSAFMTIFVIWQHYVCRSYFHAPKITSTSSHLLGMLWHRHITTRLLISI